MPSDLSLSLSRADHVATVRFERPPHNFVDAVFMERLADVFQQLGDDDDCRSIVLVAGGKAFCAGADLSSSPNADDGIDVNVFYRHAMRLFDCPKPIVAAVQGAAVGAGTGLALVADFRVACPEARFTVNFNRLGFHPGFGLSYTLPRLIGVQQAASLFYSGRRIGGDEAFRIGLADALVPAPELIERAQALAVEIARSAPLAVQSTRATLRGDFAEQVRAANRRELQIQSHHFTTDDFREGVAAMGERRLPRFTGH